MTLLTSNNLSLEVYWLISIKATYFILSPSPCLASHGAIVLWWHGYGLVMMRWWGYYEVIIEVKCQALQLV